jgi:hypothetical protein
MLGYMEAGRGQTALLLSRFIGRRSNTGAKKRSLLKKQRLCKQNYTA